MAPRDEARPGEGTGEEAAANAVKRDDDSADGGGEPAGRSRWRRRVFIGLVAVLGPLAALLLGIYIYLSGGRYIVTDNAYVKSDKIAISADISGRVTRAAISDNELVAPGEVLFRIDQTPFKIALSRAEARVAAARQEVASLKASFRQQTANLNRAQSEVAYHQEQFARQQKLQRRNLVSGLNYDTAERNLRNARDQVKMTEQAVAGARAKLGSDPDRPVSEHASVVEALADRDAARLDLERTMIKAPVRGIVTNFDLQRGEFVRAGAPVFSLVGVDRLWVEANYKETALTHVRVGQSATVSVDTYPGKTFAARVAGIAPATGAEFAVLPPQNATGNWVKVVQRLTVRLELADVDGPDAGKAERSLRAGMSAHVEIDTGHRRRISGILGPISDFIGMLIPQAPLEVGFE